MAEINDLDPNDGSTNARFPEGQAPSTVNNGARSSEGITARWYRDTNASLVSTGSNNAYVIAANQTLTAYYDGLEIGFEANFTNDDTATLNVDSLGAQSIVLSDGTALTGGEIVSGQKVFVVYDLDNTQWQLINPAVSGLKPLPVGVTIPYVGTTAPQGYVLAEGRTIGNSASGASERAAADTEDLFVLIWNSVSDTYAPVTPGGRGTDAETDYAANKAIKLPDLRGRSVIGSGTGADTADGGGAGVEREQGESGGSETYTLTTGQLPSGLLVYDGTAAIVGTDGTLIDAADNTRTPAGSDDPIDQMHPWRALTNIISLGTGLTNGVTTEANRDASSDTVTATGSVTARTLANRAADAVNVLDYGAVGDGATDDTTAILAAWTAAKSAGHNTVVFPPSGSSYLLGSAWTIDVDKAQIIGLEGVGGLPAEKATIKLTAQAAGIVLDKTTDATLIQGIAIDADYVADICLDIQRDTTQAGDSSNSGRFNDCDFLRAKVANVKLSGDNNQFRGCAFTRPGDRDGSGNAIDWDAISVWYTGFEEVQFHECIFQGSTGMHLRVDAGNVYVQGGRMNFATDMIVYVAPGDGKTNAGNSCVINGTYLEAAGGPAAEQQSINIPDNQTFLVDGTGSQLSIVNPVRFAHSKTDWGATAINGGELYLDVQNRVHGIYEAGEPRAQIASAPRILKTFVKGTITASTNILNVDHNSYFAVNPVGKKIRVPGAGATGADLETQITAIDVPNNQWTLADNASTTVSTPATISELTPRPAFDITSTGQMTSGSNVLTLSAADASLKRYDWLRVPNGAGAGVDLVAYIVTDANTTTPKLSRRATNTTGAAETIQRAEENMGKVYVNMNRVRGMQRGDGDDEAETEWEALFRFGYTDVRNSDGSKLAEHIWNTMPVEPTNMEYLYSLIDDVTINPNKCSGLTIVNGTFVSDTDIADRFPGTTASGLYTGDGTTTSVNRVRFDWDVTGLQGQMVMVGWLYRRTSGTTDRGRSRLQLQGDGIVANGAEQSQIDQEVLGATNQSPWRMAYAAAYIHDDSETIDVSLYCDTGAIASNDIFHNARVWAWTWGGRRNPLRNI